MSQTARPPLPPFTRATAAQKVRAAEDGWNGRDPQKVAGAYSLDSRWRNRSEFFQGREAIADFLARKWASELDYRLIKELGAFDGNQIAVRFQYEFRNPAGDWFRAYGNEQWAFDADGLMRRREASINDVAIAAQDRRFHWPLGPRPADHPGLTELGCRGAQSAYSFIASRHSSRPVRSYWVSGVTITYSRRASAHSIRLSGRPKSSMAEPSTSRQIPASSGVAPTMASTRPR